MGRFEEEQVEYMREMTSLMKEFKNDFIALRLLTISLMLSHPDLEKVRADFSSLMEHHYDSFLQSLDQKERENALAVWHATLFWIDQAIEKQSEKK